MKTLDAHGDDYRNAQLTMLLEVSCDTMKTKRVLIPVWVFYVNYISLCSKTKSYERLCSEVLNGPMKRQFRFHF